MERKFEMRRVSLLSKKIHRTFEYLVRKGLTKDPVTFDAAQQEFIRTAMVDGLNEDTNRTIAFHRKCLNADIDNGRNYWCFIQNEQVVGMSGYHQRIWDPEHIVWGGWFVADPNIAAMAKIGMLLDTLKVLLEETKYSELYIEVFADSTMSNILSIYQSLMFTELSRISNFYGEGQDMVLMKLELNLLREYWLGQYSQLQVV
jgi:hypothetical protein